MSEDSQSLLKKVSDRDIELNLNLRRISFQQLGFTAPSADDIDQALKESSCKVDADAFKKRYEALQELLKKLN